MYACTYARMYDKSVHQGSRLPTRDRRSRKGEWARERILFRACIDVSVTTGANHAPMVLCVVLDPNRRQGDTNRVPHAQRPIDRAPPLPRPGQPAVPDPESTGALVGRHAAEKQKENKGPAVLHVAELQDILTYMPIVHLYFVLRAHMGKPARPAESVVSLPTRNTPLLTPTYSTRDICTRRVSLSDAVRASFHDLPAASTLGSRPCSWFMRFRPRRSGMIRDGPMPARLPISRCFPPPHAAKARIVKSAKVVFFLQRRFVVIFHRPEVCYHVFVGDQGRLLQSHSAISTKTTIRFGVPVCPHPGT